MVQTHAFSKGHGRRVESHQRTVGGVGDKVTNTSRACFAISQTLFVEDTFWFRQHFSLALLTLFCKAGRRFQRTCRRCSVCRRRKCYNYCMWTGGLIAAPRLLRPLRAANLAATLHGSRRRSARYARTCHPRHVCCLRNNNTGLRSTRR
jgi:hypothetical protein